MYQLYIRTYVTGEVGGALGIPTHVHNGRRNLQLPKNHESTLIYHALRGVYIKFLTAYAAGLAERQVMLQVSPALRA